MFCKERDDEIECVHIRQYEKPPVQRRGETDLPVVGFSSKRSAAHVDLRLVAGPLQLLLRYLFIETEHSIERT